MKTAAFLISAVLATGASFALPPSFLAAAPHPIAPAPAPLAPEEDCTGCVNSINTYTFTGAPNCDADVGIAVLHQFPGTCDLQTCTPATPCKFVIRSYMYGDCLTYYFENTFSGVGGLFSPDAVHYDTMQPPCGAQGSIIIETVDNYRLAQLDFICSSCTR